MPFFALTVWKYAKAALATFRYGLELKKLKVVARVLWHFGIILLIICTARRDN